MDNIDCSVFMKIEQGGTISIIFAYVNNLIFLSSDATKLDRHIGKFFSIFDETVNPLSSYLGFHITVQDEVMNFSQAACIIQILGQFKLQDCCTYKTLKISNFLDELSYHAEDEAVSRKAYRNMIGSLLFPSHLTRPDISLPVGILSQYTNRLTNLLLKFEH